MTVESQLKQILRRQFEKTSMDPADVPVLITRMARDEKIQHFLKKHGSSHEAFNIEANIIGLATKNKTMYFDQLKAVRHNPNLLFARFEKA